MLWETPFEDDHPEEKLLDQIIKHLSNEKIKTL